MDPFKLTNYDMKPTDNNYTLINNGHTLQVGFPEKFFNVSGGGLTGVYTTVQAHLHWGSDDKQGSEHTMNGKKYPAEVSKWRTYLVFKNCMQPLPLFTRSNSQSENVVSKEG